MTKNQSSTAKPENALRVLVVDDDREFADSITILAQTWGHSVKVAYEAATALEIALSFRPHVALIDLAMPNVDGFTLAREIRKSLSTHQTILLAVTGYSESLWKKMATDSGMNHYLEKPIDPDQLQALLEVAATAVQVVASRDATPRQK